MKSPNTRHTNTQSKNATNMYYECIRGDDSENFGVRITRIGVVVKNIWLKEVLGAKLKFWKSMWFIWK
jgi:hypothetical protein